MMGCLDCTMLEQRVTQLNQRLQAVVHERDRLIDQPANVQQGTDRHWLRVSCDRCGNALEISTTLATLQIEHCQAMLAAAIALGWELGEGTLWELGGYEPLVGQPSRDLCRTCHDILQPRRGK